MEHHQKFNGELQVEQLSLIVAELRRTNNLLAHFIARMMSPEDMMALEQISRQTEAVLKQAETLAAGVNKPPTKE